MPEYAVWTTEGGETVHAPSPHEAAALFLYTIKQYKDVFVQEITKQGESRGPIARFERLPSTVTSMVQLTGGGWTQHISVALPPAIQ